MLNQNKIRLMTKLAMEEEHHEKELQDVKAYYRSDYISVRMFKNALRLTLAFGVGFLLWGCCNLDAVMKRLNTMDILGMGMRICIFYILFLAAGLLFTYMMATRSYFRGLSELQKYQVLLERLSRKDI